jgi:hypothetical protein
MAVFSTMRRVWIALSLTVALLAFFPAWNGRTSWWLFGISFTLFAVFLLEPWLLTWELRKSGDQLQINDEGILRRVARGQIEQVNWGELREISLIITQDARAGGQAFYVLAGTGKSGVLVSHSLAVKHDLLSHLAKLPGFDHRNIPEVAGMVGDHRFVLWRAQPLVGEAQVIPMNRLDPPTRTLH